MTKNLKVLSRFSVRVRVKIKVRIKVGAKVWLNVPFKARFRVRFSLRNTFNFKFKGKFRVSDIQFSFIKLGLFKNDLFYFSYLTLFKYVLVYKNRA